VLYVTANAFFATIYLILGDSISGAEQGSFVDALAFSIQTMSTIGYGGMTPKGTWADVLVGVESLVGLLLLALATGIVFTRFARPTAGVIFSDKAILGTRDGQPCLMFRLANERGSDIVEASLRVTALMDEVTTEGHRMRRLHDLALLRGTTPLLLMSWLVVHPIDEESPLHGKSAQDLCREDIRFITNMTGIDGTFMQTVYAYHMYTAADIAQDVHFEDVITPLPDGRFELDLTKFHEVRALREDS
jgi:inward rectifier potassium channel